MVHDPPGARRLAIFIHDLDGGGAQRFVVQLANGLAMLGEHVDVVLVRTEGPYLEQLASAVRVVPLRRTKTMFAIGALARYIDREHPAALISALTISNVAAAFATLLARHATHLILTEHSLVSRSGPSAALTGRIAWRLMRFTYRRARHVVCVSSAAAADLAAHLRWPARRLHVIPNPVISPDLLSLAAVDSEHPWFGIGQPAVVIAAGRLDPVKDYETMFRSVALVHRTRPLRLIVLGEGAERERLQSLIESFDLSDSIQLFGFTANPYSLIARASLLVLSSRWEGFGNVLVEAMACGTPVVSTDCGGPREVLADGRYGRLVPVGDASALAAAMTETLDEPPNRAELRRRAQEFSIDVIARRYADLVT